MTVQKGGKVKLTFCYKVLAAKRNEAILILVPVHTLAVEDPFTLLLRFKI